MAGMNSANAASPAVEDPASPLLVRIMCAARDAKDAPKPDAVDEFAVEFDRLDRELTKAVDAARDAAKPVATLKSELIELVKKFGGPHGKSSKLLHGIFWELMGTYGKTTVTDNAAIERFRVALQRRHKTALLKKLFSPDVRWTFSSQAMEIIKAEKKPLTPKLMGLLLMCFDTRDCTPKLDARPKNKVAA
jgi:hypothetical protein